MSILVWSWGWLLFTLFSSVDAQSNGTRNGPKAIIIDTDIMGDVDDVGALAVANVLHNCGMADLKAVMINTNSTYGALAASTINTYFGNGDIPIAAVRPLTNDTFFDSYMFSTSEYASKIAMHYPRNLSSSENTPEPLELYHSLLSSAAPNSLTLISVGFLNNLAHLLQSPTGPSLISSKVHELVIMGGSYPSGWEFNFGYQDPEATRIVLEYWPKSVPITYSGYELGANIYSGSKLKEHAPADSPILAAYEWYVTRCSTTRESWDLVTVLYGVFGLDGFETLGMKAPFEYANNDGYNSVVAANGSNAWVYDASITNQRWLKLADGVSNSSVAWILDQFYVHDPIDKSCFG